MGREQASFSNTSFLRQGADCVVRRQETEVLFYNSRTDELHLIPPAGFFVYGLCDGTRRVDEIESEVSAVLEGSGEELATRLRSFLTELVARGILEIDGAAAK